MPYVGETDPPYANVHKVKTTFISDGFGKDAGEAFRDKRRTLRQTYGSEKGTGTLADAKIVVVVERPDGTRKTSREVARLVLEAPPVGTAAFDTYLQDNVPEMWYGAAEEAAMIVQNDSLQATCAALPCSPTEDQELREVYGRRGKHGQHYILFGFAPVSRHRMLIILARSHLLGVTDDAREACALIGEILAGRDPHEIKSQLDDAHASLQERVNNAADHLSSVVLLP